MKNPAQRLGSNGSVDTVRQHPFFNWQALQEKQVKPPQKEKVAKKSEEDTQRSYIKSAEFEIFLYVNGSCQGLFDQLLACYLLRLNNRLLQ